jgi:uncharacterized protein YcgI (DUF1989 family)
MDHIPTGSREPITVIDIPPASGRSFKVEKSQRLRVIDIEGQQVGDLICFNLDDFAECISTGHTRSINRRLRVSRGDSIYSNLERVMFSIEEDTCGVHDLLFPPCNRWLFEKVYNVSKTGCLEHLIEALKPLNFDERDIPHPFNVFMRTDIVDSDEMQVLEPVSKTGDFIDLRAEMDLMVALSTCAVEESLCNAGSLKPLRVEIYA